MRVIDSSVVVSALTDSTLRGQTARARMSVLPMHAPEVLDLEVLSALRRTVRGGHLPGERARQAVLDLASAPIVRHRHIDLLPRIWELRDNITAYDAAYVALAEFLHAPFLTEDAKLAGAPGWCEVERP